jgi:hypothetical protein
MKRIVVLVALTATSLGATAGPITIDFTAKLTSLYLGTGTVGPEHDAFGEVGDPNLTGHFYIDRDAVDPDARVVGSLQFSSGLNIGHGATSLGGPLGPESRIGFDEFFFDPEGAYLRALDDQSVSWAPAYCTELQGCSPPGNIGFGGTRGDATSLRILDGKGTGFFQWETLDSTWSNRHQPFGVVTGSRGEFAISSAIVRSGSAMPEH